MSSKNKKQTVDQVSEFDKEIQKRKNFVRTLKSKHEEYNSKAFPQVLMGEYPKHFKDKFHYDILSSNPLSECLGIIDMKSEQTGLTPVKPTPSGVEYKKEGQESKGDAASEGLSAGLGIPVGVKLVNDVTLEARPPTWSDESELPLKPGWWHKPSSMAVLFAFGVAIAVLIVAVMIGVTVVNNSFSSDVQVRHVYVHDR